MPGFDQASGIDEYLLFALDDGIGRQPAFALAQTHGTARRVKADANFLSGANLVLQPHIVGIDIQMVATRGTA